MIEVHNNQFSSSFENTNQTEKNNEQLKAITVEDKSMMKKILSSIGVNHQSSQSSEESQRQIHRLFEVSTKLGMIDSDGGNLSSDNLETLNSILNGKPSDVPDAVRYDVAEIIEQKDQLLQESDFNIESEKYQNFEVQTTVDDRRAARNERTSEREIEGNRRRESRGRDEVAVEPAPKAVEPEPKAVEPEPKAVEPDPKAVEPAPKAVEPGNTRPAVESSKPADITQQSTENSNLQSLPIETEFRVINPGEGPTQLTDENGQFQFTKVVDDSFLPKEVQTGMKSAVNENFNKLAFFKDNLKSPSEAYQFLVNMANLESGRGNSLNNDGDAANTGTGGSSGYMHLHNNFGYQETSFGGAPLNTEGWTQKEARDDYSKYTTLVMRHLDGGYQDAGGEKGQSGIAKTMSQWWLGRPDESAGTYYLSAVADGAGVNHNTGGIY